MKENSIEDIIEEKYTRYLNCETDILDLTLEEAKFILETDERRNYVTSILQEAGKVILSDYKRALKENEELKQKWDKDTHKLQNALDIANADLYSANQIINEYIDDTIPVQKVKDIIDRIDYDIKKTKEIISKNTNIYASYRKNDYQIIRLRAMNTKSLDIKKRLQKLLESEK